MNNKISNEWSALKELFKILTGDELAFEKLDKKSDVKTCEFDNKCGECTSIKDCDCGFEEDNYDDIDDFNIECGVNCDCGDYECIESIENLSDTKDVDDDDTDEGSVKLSNNFELIKVVKNGNIETRVLIAVNKHNQALTFKDAQSIDEIKNVSVEMWDKSEWAPQFTDTEIITQDVKKRIVIGYFKDNGLDFNLDTIYKITYKILGTSNSSIKINYAGTTSNVGRFTVKYENYSKDLDIVDIVSRFVVDLNKSLENQDVEFYEYIYTLIKIEDYKSVKK